ncbi:MAG: hypothetical protein LBC09_02335 [Helicobacteraceae bacterium]|jgi:hypothetical protein|nr:hypothetical protein [Helicobacteraceae bacterium]
MKRVCVALIGVLFSASGLFADWGDSEGWRAFVKGGYYLWDLDGKISVPTESKDLEDANGFGFGVDAPYFFDNGLKVGVYIDIGFLGNDAPPIDLGALAGYEFDSGASVDLRVGYGLVSSFDGLSYGLAANYRFGDRKKWQVQARYLIQDGFEYVGEKKYSGPELDATSLFVSIGYSFQR